MFRAENLFNGIEYIGMMFGIISAGVMDNTFWYYWDNGGFLLPFAAAFSLPIEPWLKRQVVWRQVEACVVAGVFVLSLMIAICATYSPFIYFNF